MIPGNRYRSLLLCFLLLCLQYPLKAQDTSTYETTQGLSPYEADSAYEAEPGAYAATETEEEEYTFTAPRDRNISQADWDKLSSSEAFSYRNKAEHEEGPPRKDKGFWLKLFRAFAAFLASGVGQVFFWGGILLLFGYILYRALKGQLGFILSRKEHRSIETITDSGTISEEDLLSADWERKVQEALSADNQRLATRYALMRVLQLLQQAELIHYRIDKTNHEYYMELGREDVRQPFRELLLRYEFAWFGRFAVTPDEWTRTRALYEQVKNAIAR